MSLLVRLKTISFVICSFALALLAGLREGNDPDYPNYYDIYISSTRSDFSSLNVEPVFFYINKLLSSAGIPFWVLLLMISFPAIFLKLYVIFKKSHYMFFSILIYILTIYLSFELIAIRQGLAIGCIMFAAAIWPNNKYTGCILILFGSLFHISASIALPVFFLMSSRLQKQILYLSFLSILFLSISGVSLTVVDLLKVIPLVPGFVISKLDVYASYNQVGLNSSKQFVVCCMAFFIYCYQDTENSFVKQCCFLYVVGFLLSLFFSSIGDIAFRIKWYFFWGEIIFIPYALSLSISKLKNKRAVPLLLYVFALFLLVMYLYPAISFINDISSRGNSLIL